MANHTYPTDYESDERREREAAKRERDIDKADYERDRKKDEDRSRRLGQCWERWRNAGELWGRVRNGVGFGEVTLRDERQLLGGFILQWSFKAGGEKYFRTFAVTDQALAACVSIEVLAGHIASTMKDEARTKLGVDRDVNTSEHPLAIQRIGELIRTQDNRCTADPIFIVQQRKRFYGVDLDHTDDHVWLDTANDHAEANEIEATGLDALSSEGRDVGDWNKVGYLDQWEFVTACFTEQGCKDYIDANGHNLTEPRIYAASGYRNREFIAVRDFLKSN